jgi:putative ABC transport system ATP-binding protein
VLMITHNPEAAAIGDRVLHMRDGRLEEKEPVLHREPVRMCGPED